MGLLYLYMLVVYYDGEEALKEKQQTRAAGTGSPEGVAGFAGWQDFAWLWI